MKTARYGIFLCFLTLFFSLPLAAAPSPALELLKNGDFEAGQNAPEGWPLPKGAIWEQENGNHFLRLRASRPGETISLSHFLPLQPDWEFLRVTCRVRTQNIVRGPEGWHTGRVAMMFQDARGQRVGDWPDVLNWTGTIPEWRTATRDYAIPKGANRVQFDFALFSVEEGQIDFDDVHITVIKPRLEDVPMPSLAKGKPWRAETATRGRICLNGLWRFRPIGLGDDISELTPEMLKTPPTPPRSPGWGWFAVPGSWPRHCDGHRPIAPDIWSTKVKWEQLDAAWYQRELAVPAAWKGRRIRLSLDVPQTQADFWLDDQPAGKLRWPGGTLDITRLVTPGKTYRLTAFVTALPFNAEKLVAMRDDMVFKAKADVHYRGLCGDVYLESVPAHANIASVQFRPSVRTRSLGMRLQLEDAAPGARYQVTVTPRWQNRAETTWTSAALKPAADGSLTLRMPWSARRRWDLDQPNFYQVSLQLRRAGSAAVLDARSERLGFREVWLQGRNIMLNGAPIHWRTLDFNNPSMSAASASYSACRDTFRRMRALGFNFGIFSNYDFDPGQIMGAEDILRAADDAGFLLSFTQPHPLGATPAFDPKTGKMNPEWMAIANYSVRLTENHPSVLAYAMSHNRLGYNGDQDPAHMDGKQFPQSNTARVIAAACEAYVKHLDPTRLVYHHESGNMGDWHTVNIYLNWSPIQERMEWLSHWAREGVKPLFFVEWGLPHVASWGSHRLGPFIWTNNVNSEPWAVEYGAAITGEDAYRLAPTEEENTDRYERVYARGKPFHITEVLGDYWNNSREHNMVEIQSAYTRHTWPALRTWGISAMLPWDQGNMSRTRPGSTRTDHTYVWKADDLTKPGIHPDFAVTWGDYFSTGNPEMLELTSLGETFRRVNADLFAYIAGKPERFTEQGHLFRPGETVTKQAIVINDLRLPCRGSYTWSALISGKKVGGGTGTFVVRPGEVWRGPLHFRIPENAAGSGSVALSVNVKGKAPLHDSFAFSLVPAPQPVSTPVAVYDPQGETLRDLQRLHIATRPVAAGESLDGVKALVVGKRALTVDGPAPAIAPLLARGGTVLVLEQEEAVLSRRLGFRTNTPSLRNVCVRTPDHPALRGLSNELLRDWRGTATLIPERYNFSNWETSYPEVNWLGYSNSRVWKWGNQGQVASVVIEKPQGGDFLPLLDGGFDLQYAPLLEARAGNGRILFCQMDVSGRSEADPAADRLLAQLTEYARTAPAPEAARPVVCVGSDATRRLLTGLGANLSLDVQPGPETVVVADGQTADLPAVRAAAEAGARVLLLDGNKETAQALFPTGATIGAAALTHTPPPLQADPAWRGVGPAEVHFRGRTPLTTVKLPQSSGASLSTGVLAAAPLGKGRVVYSAVSPLRFDYTAPNKPYLKLTYKRTAFLVSRLLANEGAAFTSPLLENWERPAATDLELPQGWIGRADAKETFSPEAVSAPDMDRAGWQAIKVPGNFDSQLPALADYDGVFWYRLEFDASAVQAGVDSVLSLGAVDDEDWTYLNGKFIGHIGQDTDPQDYWSALRRYPLKAGALKPGKNILVVKVRDLRGGGGIVSTTPAIREPSARWISSYYLDQLAGNDDPYRYNRW